MARVTTGQRRASIDPLKHSPALGGTMAFLGLDRCIPLVHGSQGCAAFAKALLTRHFREPIPLQTTAITQLSAVLGSSGLLTEALDTITARQQPDIVGVLTTSLTEASGDDSAATVSQYMASRSCTDTTPVIHVSTPDFTGGLQDGWASAVEAIVGAFAEPGPPVDGQVNLLTGPALSPLDVEELRLLMEAFGLDAVVLPDLAGSLDGHLDDHWSALTTGGTTLADLRRIGSSRATIVAGAGVAGAGSLVEARCGIPPHLYPRLSGLGPVDALVADLAEISGRAVPEGVRRWRRRLADGLLDTHFVLGGARVALALEPDLLYAVGSLLTEVGAEVVTAVAPTSAHVLGDLPCDEVVVGDLAHFDEMAADAGAQLVVGSSHARPVAERIGASHLCMGFPVYDRLGPQLRLTAGYRGSLELLIDAANCMLHGPETRHAGRPFGRARGDRLPDRVPGRRTGSLQDRLPDRRTGSLQDRLPDRRTDSLQDRSPHRRSGRSHVGQPSTTEDSSCCG